MVVSQIIFLPMSLSYSVLVRFAGCFRASNNLTKDYEMQILKMEDKVGIAGNALTIEDLRDELNLRFERLNTRDDSDNDEDEEEKALFGGGQFKGRCNNCGKYGHKSADCRSGGKGPKKTFGNFGNNGGYKGGTSSFKSNDAKFKGNCWNCNKPGHRSADCRSAKKFNGEQANKASENEKKEKYHDQGDVVLLATKYSLVAIDEDEMEDLAMLATEEVEETPRAHQETAGPKTTGLMPNPLDLLVEGIKATESETIFVSISTLTNQAMN